MPQILLATYNGERFLQQQLDSLLAQTDPDWTLLIRDDASTDRTPQIIEQFAKDHPDKVTVMHDHDDGRPNDNLGGSTANFAKLVQISTDTCRYNPYLADPYVMFCDQDDIWHADKIEKSVAKMREMEREFHTTDKPLVAHADFAVMDQDMNLVFPSNNRAGNHHKEQARVSTLLTKNMTYGMTIIMNRPAMEKALPFPLDIGHDHWVTKVAAVLGHVGYIDEPLIDYRRHDRNVSGLDTDNRPLPERLLSRIREKKLGEVLRKHVRIMRAGMDYSIATGNEILNRYGPEIPPDKKELLEQLVSLPDEPVIAQRVKMLRHDLLPIDKRRRAEQLAIGVKRNGDGGEELTR